MPSLPSNIYAMEDGISLALSNSDHLVEDYTVNLNKPSSYVNDMWRGREKIKFLKYKNCSRKGNFVLTTFFTNGISKSHA